MNPSVPDMFDELPERFTEVAFKAWLAQLPTDYLIGQTSEWWCRTCPIAEFLQHLTGRVWEVGVRGVICRASNSMLLLPLWAREVVAKADRIARSTPRDGSSATCSPKHLLAVLN